MVVRPILPSRNAKTVLIGAPLLVALYFMGLNNNPLFHSLVEIFSVIIACGIFMMAWNSRRYIENKTLLFIGIAYLSVGILDLVHEIAYNTLFEAPSYEPNLVTQLDVAARLIQATALLVAPFFATRSLSAGRTLLAYLAVTVLVLMSVFVWGVFPACYVEGLGPTPFKMGAELVVWTALIGAVFTFTRFRQYFHYHVFRQMLLSIILTFLSVVAFTTYNRVDDLIFLLGHVAKVVSFYFIYDAMIATGLARPYDLLVRNLKHSEQSLRDTVQELQKARAELESRVLQRTAELTKKTETLEREMDERKRAEEALVDSETKYRIVADNTRDWEWWLGTNGGFVYVSPSCKEITGHEAQEFLDDKELIYRIIHPEDRQGMIDHVAQVDREHKGGEVEFRIIRPDGSIRHLAHACQPVFNGNGGFLGHRGSNRDITERKFAEDALRESEKALRFLSAQLLTVQEKQRKRIARELHDGINQTLSAVKFSLETRLAHMDISKAPDGMSLERIISLVENGIAEARRIQMDLRPPMLDDLGIVATLQWLTREFGAVYRHIRVKLETDVDEEDVPDSLKVVLFRIVQEALNNASRHSRADSVSVSLKRVGKRIELSIVDNGVGFDMENTTRGIGISSMRERAELSLGSLDVSSAPRQGTAIRGSWPVAR
jgi:PAS domain S-box-containing protein